MDRTWKGLAHVKMQAAKTNPSINPYTILQNPIPQIFTWRSKFWCELSTLSTSIKWIIINYQMNLPSLTIPDPSRTSASSSSFSAASATICVRCRCHLDAQLPQGHLRQVWVLILGAPAQRTREQWDDHVMHRNFTMHREKKHINK